ncbi:cilia- and flagella-associated protein 251-like [Melanaphis sacchari]|uniref:cilia- and flagella-associated protein 251-like n=1 Tax=Melanaphis sacchari TaxID=742174 RepID=UPI000DC14C83|nr:cilia- and flagella-associated protein 251-like [Melanaphis sacchari]
MRAMGYFPSETELSNMLYELFNRTGNPTTITFEEFVILYLNYRPQLRIKCEELRAAFNELIQNDQFVNAYGENNILTRESFVHMMKTKGEKINPHELEIILNTLLKTTRDIGSNTNADLIHLALPFTYTFEEMFTDLLGFQSTD